MQSVVTAGVFLLFVIIPCVVATRSGATDSE